MVKEGVYVSVPNPHHGENISAGLISIILKEGGLSRDDWFSAA
jgi:hypothetical protein